jgi:hypothetical protein
MPLMSELADLFRQAYRGRGLAKVAAVIEEQVEEEVGAFAD